MRYRQLAYLPVQQRLVKPYNDSFVTTFFEHQDQGHPRVLEYNDSEHLLFVPSKAFRLGRVRWHSNADHNQNPYNRSPQL